jgi:hypothetical protein
MIKISLFYEVALRGKKRNHFMKINYQEFKVEISISTEIRHESDTKYFLIIYNVYKTKSVNWFNNIRAYLLVLNLLKILCIIIFVKRWENKYICKNDLSFNMFTVKL